MVEIGVVGCRLFVCVRIGIDLSHLNTVAASFLGGLKVSQNGRPSLSLVGLLGLSFFPYRSAHVHFPLLPGLIKNWSALSLFVPPLLFMPGQRFIDQQPQRLRQ